jgi:hypothetical protein
VGRPDAAEIERREPEAFADWIGELPFPGGEIVPDLIDRAWPALAAIAGAHAGDAVAVVAHGGTNRALLCRALGLPLARLLDYGALTVLEHRGGGWALLRLNERAVVEAPAGGREGQGRRKTIGPTNDLVVDLVSLESMEIDTAAGSSGSSPWTRRKSSRMSRRSVSQRPSSAVPDRTTMYDEDLTPPAPPRVRQAAPTLRPPGPGVPPSASDGRSTASGKSRPRRPRGCAGHRRVSPARTSPCRPG